MVLIYKADSAIIKSFKSYHLVLSEVQKFPYFVQLSVLRVREENVKNLKD